MKTLIVVDMQNDFVHGPLGTPEARAIIPNIKKKIDQYIEHGDRVIFTRDTHATNAYLKTNEGRHLPIKHCIYGTKGWMVVDELDVTTCEHINKPTFGWTYWDNYLFEEIELCGVCTDICVASNALMLKAMFSEINITVDANCCAGTTPENHKAALQVMKSCQIEVME